MKFWTILMLIGAGLVTVVLASIGAIVLALINDKGASQGKRGLWILLACVVGLILIVVAGTLRFLI